MLKNPIRQSLAAIAIALVSMCAHAGTMSMSAPVAGTTVTSPIHVVANASTSSTITGYKIYLDGTAVFSQASGSIDTFLNASAGSHKITAKAWDSSGAILSSSATVTVSGTTSTTTPPTSSFPTIPSNAITATHIEDMSGWGSCTDCAGGGANAIYSWTQHQASPSLDGSSGKIFLGGTTPFSHALIWRRMGSSTTATNFVFDMYYMIGNPAASQGLEFAANQGLSTGWYKFSTQCAFSNSQWRVWDSKNAGWVNTGITCVRPPANTWQHVTFEYQRAGGKAVFVAITLNGKKSYVNRSFYPQAKTGDGSVGIHFQTDGNSTQADYTTWIDKLSFYYW
jgi:Bacterial Ig domain